MQLLPNEVALNYKHGWVNCHHRLAGLSWCSQPIFGSCNLWNLIFATYEIFLQTFLYNEHSVPKLIRQRTLSQQEVVNYNRDLNETSKSRHDRIEDVTLCPLFRSSNTDWPFHNGNIYSLVCTYLFTRCNRTSVQVNTMY